MIGLAAAARLLQTIPRGHAPEMGGGGLAAQALQVVTGGDDPRTGRVGAHPTGRDQVRSGGGDQGPQQR